jgi:hypothetical protein
MSAPERIWARFVEGFGAVQIGQWADSIRIEPHGTEYIRADIANAEIDAAAVAALNAAADMVASTAYTSTGEGRALEPVSAGLVGMDMHHATIAAAIRALAACHNDKYTTELSAQRDKIRAALAGDSHDHTDR